VRTITHPTVRTNADLRTSAAARRALSRTVCSTGGTEAGGAVADRRVDRARSAALGRPDQSPGSPPRPRRGRVGLQRVAAGRPARRAGAATRAGAPARPARAAAAARDRRAARADRHPDPLARRLRDADGRLSRTVVRCALVRRRAGSSRPEGRARRMGRPARARTAGPARAGRRRLSAQSGARPAPTTMRPGCARGAGRRRMPSCSCCTPTTIRSTPASPSSCSTSWRPVQTTHRPARVRA